MKMTVAALLLLLVSNGPQSVRAEVGAADGVGASRWGEVAPPNEENTAVFEDAPKSVWAHAVDLPFQTALFPLRLAAMGVEEVANVAGQPWVRRIFEPLRFGPVMVTPNGGYSSRDGFGASLGVEVPDFLRSEGQLRLAFSGTTRGQGKAILGVRVPRTQQSWVEVGAGYRSDINARFFGFGPESSKDRESFYRKEVGWLGLTIGRRIGSQGFALETSAIYSGVSANGTNESETPQLSTEFAPELAAREITGYRDRSDGPMVSIELRHDDALRTDRPEHGGVRRAKVSYFKGRGQSLAEAWTYRGELQQFLPLWHSRRALAVRLFYSYIDDVGDDPLPFQRLLTNDDPDLLRGFPDERFHDQGLWAASFEYRWPFWNFRDLEGLGLDAYAFVDVGQVFNHPRDATDDVTQSYGGGFRLGGDGRFVGRVEVANCDEGWQFRLRADQVLQFVKGGLSHGRNPVPAR